MYDAGKRTSGTNAIMAAMQFAGYAWAMTVRLATFYATVFLFVGIHLPFWPVWLEARGLTAAEIGVILSASTWTRSLVSPIVGHVADRRGERKRVIVVLLVGAFAVYFLFAVAETFWTLLAISLLVGVFLSAVIPLGENLAMLTAHERNLDYGRIRLWGSIAFIGGAGLGGQLLAGRDESLILWLLLAALALNVLAGLWLPDTRPPPARRHRAPALALLRDRGFVVFLVTAGLIQGSHAVYYGFATLHWRSAGISEGVIGALWAEGVVAEIVLFFFAARMVATVGPIRLMAVAAIGGIVRWTVLGATTSLGALFAVQTLHALTFAAAHLAAMHFLTRAVPAEHSATAQSLYAGLGTGLTIGLTMIAGGWLYGLVGGQAFYAMTAMVAAGLAMTPFLARAWPSARR